MKILIINGSPHKGNTWLLTEEVKEQIAVIDNTVKFEEIHLSELNIPFCIGCSMCFREGLIFCPHNQYIQPIMDKIEGCDGVIFSVSCFQGAVTAITKNFTDHLAFLLHRPRYFYKKALIISTTGGVSANSVTQSLANTLPGWGFNKCYQLPIVALSWNAYKPTEKHKKKAFKISKAFYMDLKSKKLHSPKIGVLIPFNLFQAMCKEYTPGSEYSTQDGVFWKKYVGMRYAPGIPLPIYKMAIGRIIFQIGKYLSPKMIVTYKK
ncbi:flavodoxin family protein [Clostridium omnivorum]|uniref:Iron-sulfur flavoprotein n=1 Tax=Clostridium omnivorum TaxID=1604902 RepID=A0ABQ5N4N9_9CLOT|nr:NAD(P)H-dependent oxidoreductase [Clostridium sp. E14]GLC30163.1 iron-sulfur flavoprotein [Clostridium sp. E14]